MTVWEDVVGQGRAVAVLARAAAAAATGEPGMTHAWLFTGPPGSGRSTAARAFAAALQCPRRGCGSCETCHTVVAGTHPDVDLIATDRLHLLIAEARGIVARAARAPAVGRWQVILVEDADRMEERTSNTVLKAVEEPAPHAVWLLCAPSTEDVLPTIRSRCRQVPLRTPPTAAVADLLVRRDGVDRALAAYAARVAQGHVGRARRLATDEVARRRRKEALAIARVVGGLDAGGGAGVAPRADVGACLAVAANLVEATADEADAATAGVNAAETAAVREALGEGGAGRRLPRGSAGALRELEERQRSRGTRARRDALDRALTDVAGLYRDVLVHQLGARIDVVNDDERPTIARLAGTSTPELTLRRIEAVLACRAALDANAHPQLAVEAMTLALRVP